jgi:ribosome biogenesis GTPase
MSLPVHGRIVTVRSRRFTAEIDGEPRQVIIPKRLRHAQPEWVDPVAVGDRVRLEIHGEDAVVEEVLPRSNALSRPASGRRGKRQVLAANLDRGLIVLSARSPSWKRTTLDRYMVLLSASGVAVSFVLNKIDLAPGEDSSPDLVPYRNLGLEILFTSAETGEGMDKLRTHLQNGTSVLIGSSGVGKSSLINALDPEAGLRVGEVSERTDKGTHTTTWVESIPLLGGGDLIDSPGIRVLDLSGVAPEELANHFPEFAQPTSECRFANCRHHTEPICGVKEALEEGRIDAGRYDSYLRIRESLREGRG